jgi:hypothetical protein
MRLLLQIIRHFITLLGYTVQYSRVGRILSFYTFLTKDKQRSIVHLVKEWKIGKKVFGPVDLYRRGHDF